MSESAKVNPIPDGYHTITPGLMVHGADAAIDFYRRAFGAEAGPAFRGPDGKVMHVELTIGDSRLMLGEEMPDMGYPGPKRLGGTPCGLYVYVKDVDQSFERALKAGATVRQPIQDQFWGDREGSLTDPFGHVWSLATRKENLSPEETQRRGEEFMRKMGAQ